MDLFEKCREFYSDPDYAQRLGYPTNPRMAQALGLYPFLLPIERPEGTEVVVDGKRLIMLGSNNYLGLSADHRVREAAIDAIRKFGTGCTGSRFLNGTLEMHQQLEKELADLVGKERALVFPTGYQTNVGVIGSLMGRHSTVIADRDSHASIIDGIFAARGARGVQARFFRHNDMASLETALAAAGSEHGCLVVLDGVFSMTGDIAPLPDVVQLCRRYAARVMVDDAHALGVLGGGRGTAFHFGCVDEVDLVMGTFSKSFASNGGFVAGSKEVIQWIQHFARSFMFSASLSPPNVATVLASLAIVREEPWRVQRVNDVAARMREELRSLEYDIGTSETPIVPIIVGDQFRALQAWHTLRKAGVYVNVALPPAVPSQRSMLRTSYMATHTDEQLERVLGAFQNVRKKLQRRLTARV
jgi:8-amino-7-oxononanoate synthase